MTRPVRDAVEPELSGVVTGLTCLGILMLFTMPTSLLDLMGMNYATPSGAAYEKVHPGSDVIFAAAGLAAARAGNPIRWLSARLRRFPGVALFLATVGLLIVYDIKVQQAPFTPLIDTFLMPAILFLLLAETPARGRTVLEVGLHVIVAVNAVLGIVEMLTGWRLIPVVLNDQLLTSEVEWRAFGLLGHPLASAATAGLYASILGLGFGKALPAWLRLPAIALQIVALGAFGGRTALVLTLAVLAVLVVRQGSGILAGQRLNRRAVTLAILFAPIGAVAVGALLQSGFFDQLMARFVDDNGSAQARATIFNLFPYFSWPELLIGPDQTRLESVQHLEGIEVGIESFWFGFIMQFGLVVAMLFFLAFALFLGQVVQRCDRLAWVSVLFFLADISTSNSLNSKTTSLGQLIVMLVILVPPLPRPVRLPSRRPLTVPA